MPALYYPLENVFFPLSLVLAIPQYFSGNHLVLCHPAKSTVTKTRLHHTHAPSYHQHPSTQYDYAEYRLPFDDQYLDQGRVDGDGGHSSYAYSSPDAHVFEELEELQRRTGFCDIPPRAVFNIFREGVVGGRLSRPALEDCVGRFLEGAGAAYEGVAGVLVRLFDLFAESDDDDDGFDGTDGSDSVDFRAFSAGLTLLCRGRPDEKVALAFNSFDSDGDGLVSLSELTVYLVSFFR